MGQFVASCSLICNEISPPSDLARYRTFSPSCLPTIPAIPLAGNPSAILTDHLPVLPHALSRFVKILFLTCPVQILYPQSWDTSTFSVNGCQIRLNPHRQDTCNSFKIRHKVSPSYCILILPYPYGEYDRNTIPLFMVLVFRTSAQNFPVFNSQLPQLQIHLPAGLLGYHTQNRIFPRYFTAPQLQVSTLPAVVSVFHILRIKKKIRDFRSILSSYNRIFPVTHTG